MTEATQPQQQAQSSSPAAQEPVAAANPVPEPAEVRQNAAPQPESDERLFAAIGYVFFLFIIPLLVKPKSKYCKFHAQQSMVLFLTSIIVLIVLAAVPWIGSLLTLAIFAIYVLAIYKSYKGELWAIPLISKLAGKMNVETLYGKAGVAMSTISGMKEKAQDLAQQAAGSVKSLGAQEPEKQEQASAAPVSAPAAPLAQPAAPAVQPPFPPAAPPNQPQG